MEILWYYGQNNGTIPITMELRFTKEKKNMVNYQKLRNLYIQTMVILW